MEEFTEIEPCLGEKKREFMLFCEKLARIGGTQESIGALKDLRSSITPKGENLSKEETRFFLAANVMLDLVGQGWKIRTAGVSVAIAPPLVYDGSPASAIKDVIRRGHLIERDEQLREPSVITFVRRMESGSINGNKAHSIFSLMRDGSDLAENLRQAASIPDENVREERLRTAIRPYIEFVEPNKRCVHTGLFLQDIWRYLFLQDIWRYFRYTWVNAYKSLPGRSVQVLIRDAAAPNHPIIGIAALGSSVVQQTIRDQRIGWDASSFVCRL